jgi:hypothetical protein
MVCLWPVIRPLAERAARLRPAPPALGFSGEMVADGAVVVDQHAAG